MKYAIAALLIMLSTEASADLVHNFKNPSFSGNGYSNHVLSIEQLGFNRQKDIDDAAQAEIDRIERELENSTLNKFLRNIESRIYATLSKQMVDNMFADCADETGATCPSSGTTELEGASISWERDTTTGSITLTVVEDDGGTTTVTIPGAGEFNF
jgi:hypothetical protein